jgi:hypothetical protein
LAPEIDAPWRSHRQGNISTRQQAQMGVLEENRLLLLNKRRSS